MILNKGTLLLELIQYNLRDDSFLNFMPNILLRIFKIRFWEDAIELLGFIMK
jgi:hypothetical protein